MIKSYLLKARNLIEKKQSQVFLLVILGIAAFWRLFNISGIPAGLNVSEYNLAIKFQTLSKTWLIAPKDIYNALYIYMQGALSFITGGNVLASRLLQVALSIIAVYVFYVFVRDWFNKQTALLATLLFSTSFLSLLVSRNLQPQLIAPLLILLVFFTFTNAAKRESKLMFTLSGIILGLLLYTDQIFIFLPVAIALLILYVGYKSPGIIKNNKVGIIISAVAFLVTAVPYLILLPQTFVGIISQFNPGSIGGYYLNLGSNIQSIVFQSPLNNTYNVGIEPILDPFIAISFICGLAYALFYLKRKKFLYLVSWLLIGVGLVSLKSKVNLTDFYIVLPVFYIISAIMLDYVLTHWVRTFPFNKSARLLMTFVFSLFLFLSIFYNYQKYFWAWGGSDAVKSNYKYQIENINK